MNAIVPADFWSWAFSDFLSNALRGVLAEYIVAKALQCSTASRVEWDAYDLETPSGLRIEVKSAAYLQTWQQKALSPIRFNIAPKKGWDSKTNTSAIESARSAHVYVFCVFRGTVREADAPLNLDQWFFLVCSTETLNKRFGSQKSASLASLERIGLERLTYQSLASHIEQLGTLPAVPAAR
jgi:hypothetical protein